MVSNVKRKLRLSRQDVELIDGSGNTHLPLGSGDQTKRVWQVAWDWQEIEPKRDNACTWIFSVPTAAVSGAVIRFQDRTYPLNLVAHDVVPVIAHVAGSGSEASRPSAIFDAVYAADSAVVQALLYENPGLAFNRDSAGATPLLLAAAKGRMEIAELLLASKAEVNATAGNGRTPLHMAAANDHKDVVELLLANKADPNAKDNNGSTPLHLALAGGHMQVAELLRQHGGHE
jgi:hypothetical protein